MSKDKITMTTQKTKTILETTMPDFDQFFFTEEYEAEREAQEAYQFAHLDA